MMNHPLTRLLAAVATLSCVACGEVDVDPTEAPTRPDAPTLPLDIMEKIRDGVVTTERPEVGRIGGCTATLVAADVAITASHCVGYRTRTSLGSYMTFRIKRDGQTHSYRVNRYKSFGSGLGEFDIALLGLAEMVPGDIAQPAPLAHTRPSQGTALTVYGYGCTRIGGSGDGNKRKATYEQGDRAQHLCPGDSGGPVFNDETGEVLRINSGYRLDQGRTDIYGIVPSLYDRLREQVGEWSQGELPEAEPLDPNAKICGRNVDVYELWTCTGARAHRYRCLPGGSPTWEPCDLGCTSQPRTDDDLCKQEEGEDTCGDTYRPYSEWVCTTDNATLLRCHENRLEVSRCAIGCEYTGNSPDVCKE